MYAEDGGEKGIEKPSSSPWIWKTREGANCECVVYTILYAATIQTQQLACNLEILHR